MKKKILIVLGIILIIGIIGIVGLFEYRHSKDQAQQNTVIDDFVESAKENGETYLILEINPKLMLILDENNKVKNISQLNDDASIFKNEEFENLNLDEAISKVITVAKENNYLTDKKDISVYTLTDDDKIIETVKNYIIENDNEIVVKEVDKSKEELHDEIVKMNKEQIKKIKGEYDAKMGQYKQVYISDVKRYEQEYVDKLNKFISQGYTYDEEATKKYGEGESIWYSRTISQYFEDDGEYADVEESYPILTPTCDLNLLSKEECKTYCPHCRYIGG